MTTSQTIQVNTAPLLENQLVSALLEKPEIIGRYPDGEGVLTVPFCVSAYKAVDHLYGSRPGAKPDYAAIAARMASNGAKGTTKQTLEEHLKQYPPASLDPDITWKVLQEQRVKRVGAPIIERYLQAVISGRMSFSEAIAGMQVDAASIADESSIVAYSTDNWQALAKELSQKQKALAASGKLTKFLENYDAITARMSPIHKGILTIFADTGAGKTIMAQAYAHYLAEKHGRTIVFVATEAGADDMLWRWIAKTNPHVTYEDLQGGYTDATIDGKLVPYKSGGRVIYVPQSGLRLETLIAYATKLNADVVCDLITDLSFENFRAKGANTTEMYRAGMKAVERYCQQREHIWVNTLQSTAAGRRFARKSGKGLDAEDVDGGAVWENKSGMFLVLRSFRMEVDTVFVHPTRKDATTGKPYEHKVREGSNAPVMELYVQKSRYGRPGARQLLWQEGPQFSFTPINEERLIKEYKTLIYPKKTNGRPTPPPY